MSDHNAKWKKNGESIILNAHKWIWIWVVALIALYWYDSAPLTFLLVSLPLGFLWLGLWTLMWRYRSYILFIVTAVVCRVSLSLCDKFFDLGSQYQELQGLVVGVIGVGAIMISCKEYVLKYGKLDKIKQTEQDAA